MLLSIIGINMIREAFSGDEESSNDLLDCKTMFPLAVATSIDALAVGITFAFLNVHIIPAVSFIGVITFIIAAAGVKIRKHIRDKIQRRKQSLPEVSS